MWVFHICNKVKKKNEKYNLTKTYDFFWNFLKTCSIELAFYTFRVTEGSRSCTCVPHQVLILIWVFCCDRQLHTIKTSIVSSSKLKFSRSPNFANKSNAWNSFVQFKCLFNPSALFSENICCKFRWFNLNWEPGTARPYLFPVANISLHVLCWM